MSAPLPPRDWTQLQPLGSGTIRIVEDNGGWAIELDGVRRTYRGQRARAETDCAAIYAALAPESTCPVCGKYVRENRGVIPAHNAPHLYGQPSAPCPGGRTRGGR